GLGGLQVEEISARWLHPGANVVTFLPVAERAYEVRNPRIVVVGAEDLRAAAGVAFRERVQPHHVAFRLSKPTPAHLTLHAWGGETTVHVAGLEAGWHWRPVDLPPADRVVADAPSEIAELSIVASPLPSAGKGLVVDYPLHGECAGAGGYLRGFA